MYDYDFFVMGAGSGGVRACRVAAGHGARVAVAEDRNLGGTCVNVGCVPKKLLVYASHFAHDFEDAAGFGWTVGERKFDWSKLIANKNDEISRLNGIYQNMLEGSGVRIINGTVRLEDAHTVAVGDDRYTADYILVAVGGWPVVPDIPGKELAITSNDAFFLHDLPERVLVVGGGYISVEFAGIFHGLGAQVTQIYRGPMFLRGFDDDLREFLAGEMFKKKIDVRFDTTITSLVKIDGGVEATLTDGSTLEADVVMYATGRAPMTANIGLEAVGIELNAKGAVVVDEYSKTSVDNIYAVGDVTDRINLTPVAIREGHAVSDTLFGNKPSKADHVDVPSAVFSQPPIGSVGLTEAEARKQYGAVDVYKSDFRAMKHTLSGNDEKVLMKLIVDRASDRVLGCHMIGPEAGEIIQGIGIAVKCGATKAQF
ncbi:MAG: glutathione-disulfide reductase, partial [Alphaproteobacteria bacterium]